MVIENDSNLGLLSLSIRKAPNSNTMVLTSLSGEAVVSAFLHPSMKTKTPSPSPLLQAKDMNSLRNFYTVWEA